jgi:hypothetical protein
MFPFQAILKRSLASIDWLWNKKRRKWSILSKLVFIERFGYILHITLQTTII